jgi:hypothetical protein
MDGAGGDGSATAFDRGVRVSVGRVGFCSVQH